LAEAARRTHSRSVSPVNPTDRRGKLLRNHDGQDLAPWNQDAESLRGGILLVPVRGHFYPYSSGVVGIENRGEYHVTLVNPTNLRLRAFLLTKKHLYAMQVYPRSSDYNRYAGMFVKLHYIALLRT
jgi:hypothetical protein